ncbi:MAG TPA: type II 3-dehydroquinate dehydratase [Bacteroidia bacterium]|nr:type II 3-dehydroquinate dehydratase [Bacteroidia bacterium]
MKIAIVNGPNLNLLGTRQTEIYGQNSFESYFAELKQKFPAHELYYFQSNVEGELVNKIQSFGKECQGIILNAGAYTHTSLALADAVAAISCPVVEVHVSNIFAREDYRHISYVGRHCKGSISGFGLKGYELALLSF